MEEFLNGDSHAIAQLLDGGDSSAAVASADNIVDCGLGHAAHITQLVDGQILFSAEFQNTLLYSFSNIYGYHLNSTQMIPVLS